MSISASAGSSPPGANTTKADMPDSGEIRWPWFRVPPYVNGQTPRSSSAKYAITIAQAMSSERTEMTSSGLPSSQSGCSDSESPYVTLVMNPDSGKSRYTMAVIGG